MNVQDGAGVDVKHQIRPTHAIREGEACGVHLDPAARWPQRLVCGWNSFFPTFSGQWWIETQGTQRQAHRVLTEQTEG
ncbi:hypothetical protein [Deinococcus rubellus]|uniref:hypothetical protein n=1 Tax=Deinococcus rubellus TaxID=1889240 RepID=UPI003CD055B2